MSDILDTQVLKLEGNSTINDNSDTSLDIDDECYEDENGRHQDYLSEGKGSVGRLGNSSAFPLVHHARAKTKMSWVWTHFTIIPDNCTHVFCHLCGKQVFYTLMQSTGMLERHIKRKHPKNFVDALKSGAKKLSWEVKSTNSHSQCSMEGYVASCPTLADCLLNRAIATYQPLRCCEEESFHELCLSLNKKSPIYGREKFHTMLQTNYVDAQQIKEIL
jgi:hypothetical protein